MFKSLKRRYQQRTKTIERYPLHSQDIGTGIPPDTSRADAGGDSMLDCDDVAMLRTLLLGFSSCLE